MQSENLILKDCLLELRHIFQYHLADHLEVKEKESYFELYQNKIRMYWQN